MKTTIIIITSLLLLSACTDVKEQQKDIPFIHPIPKTCGEKQVFHGVVKQHDPKSDGYYLDQSSNLSDANLQHINDQSLLGKTVLITGKFTTLYPPGGKPIDDNHMHAILNAKVFKIINSSKDLHQINKKCAALNVKLNKQ